MSFPEPESFNGAPGPEHDPGRSRGNPEPWKCLDCPAGGAGYVKRAKHWYATGQGHRIVWAKDPRAKHAPRESVDPAPEPQVLDGGWAGPAMMADALWYGRVLPGGLLVLDQPKDYNRAVRALAGKHVEIIIRKRKTKRSDQQNRYYFGVVVKMLAEHCGYDVQEMHETLAMRFLRIEDCPITGAPRRKHTPKTDTQEFSEYVDACIRLAAELGVVIPGPNEVAA